MTPSSSSCPQEVPGSGDPLPRRRTGSMERLLRGGWREAASSGPGSARARGRALLLPRASARGRTPLWLTRLRAKCLLASVTRYEDFPLVLEAWRTCLQDEFDLAGLGHGPGRACRGDDQRRRDGHHRPRRPSAGALPGKSPTSSCTRTTRRPSVRREAQTRACARTSCGSWRSPRSCDRACRGPHRGIPGQAAADRGRVRPRDARELLDWLKERVIVPIAEWRTLLAASSARAEGGLDAAAAGGGSSAENRRVQLRGRGGHRGARAHAAHRRGSPGRRRRGPRGARGPVAAILRTRGCRPSRVDVFGLDPERVECGARRPGPGRGRVVAGPAARGIR